MSLKKEYLPLIPLILIAAAIALSPSFSAGAIEGGRIIEIRIEDILLVILGLVWIANFLIAGRYKIKKPPLFFPILVWLSIGLVSLLTNWIFGNIGISRGFFFFLKEIEFFFLYFYLFYHIGTLDSAKFIIKIWIFLGLINIGWIVYQLITRLPLAARAHGPGFLGEPFSSFSSGGFFLILFVFFLNILIYYFLNLNISHFQKGVLMVVAVSPAIGVFASASRASFWGLIFAFILTFLFYFLKKGGLKPFFIGILVLIFISIFFIPVFKNVPQAARLLNIESFLGEFTETKPGELISRLDIWKTQLLKASESPQFLFIGLGKSVILFTEESHSQYVRNFIETGIIGSFAFLFLIFVIIKRAFRGFSLGRDPFLIGISAGLLIATLTMLFIAIPAASFLVVKIAETYWFFTALAMSTLYLNKENYGK